jgi:hypothetical protein
MLPMATTGYTGYQFIDIARRTRAAVATVTRDLLNLNTDKIPAQSLLISSMNI